MLGVELPTGEGEGWEGGVEGVEDGALVGVEVCEVEGGEGEVGGQDLLAELEGEAEQGGHGCALRVVVGEGGCGLRGCWLGWMGRVRHCGLSGEYLVDGG